MSMPITASPRFDKASTQQGGITILVVLLLLVFLTITAMAMSRNSFREIVVSGTSRQGAMTRNIADSGIEYAILWMQPPSQRTATTSDPSAVKFQALAAKLVAGQLFGIPYKLADQSAYTVTDKTKPQTDLQVPNVAGAGNSDNNGFNLALTAMGKMPMTNQSQTAGSASSGYTPAAGNMALTAPDLWAIRSDGQVNAGGNAMQFLHSKEAWISTPPR